jgi:hypothetical protein
MRKGRLINMYCKKNIQIERHINRQKERKAIRIMCMKVVDERDIHGAKREKKDI